ncbi:MAG: QueT transporter family protein [Firmicutes bacterium]|nr:QueT transporter family protein [Bacillota bacterium]
MKNNKFVFQIVTAGLIAALYAVLTYVSSLMGLAYGEVQFRISEALTILPVFTPAAIPGLTIGCFLGNLGSPFGMVDVICGTIATLIAALFSYAVRKVEWKRLPVLAPLGPVLSNAIIVGLEIAWFMPEGFTWAGFLAAAVSVGLGELVICYLLGLPLAVFLHKSGLGAKLWPWGSDSKQQDVN